MQYAKQHEALALQSLDRLPLIHHVFGLSFNQKNLLTHLESCEVRMKICLLELMVDTDFS